MRQRDLRPAALAVVRLVLRFCGWEPVYETVQDGVTIIRGLTGRSTRAPSPRDLDRLSDWALKSLASTFESEYRNVSDNDLAAAALTVADLLNSQQINDLMLRAVKDSSLLEQHLLIHGGNRRRAELLSEDAISAFDVLLRTSCRQLAELTLSAPEFGPLALQQLLQSNDRLETISRQIYESISTFSRKKYTDEEFAKYTSRYLTRVSEQLDFFDIPGVDLEHYRQRYSLSAAYIPLRTIGESAQLVEYTSLDSLLTTEQLILIVGEPGSGKSTLLKWVAVQLARIRSETDNLQFQVPFLIKLRSLTHLPDLDDIGGPMTEGLVLDKPSHWSSDLLTTGRGILLFDGLDEVPEHRRESVVRWIDELCEDELVRRGLRIIVTSRLAAIRESRFRPAKATLATLQPMLQAHIEKFVKVWHRAIFENGSSTQLDWQAVSDQLLTRLERDRQLSRIASNPLLCAVVCALYHARNQHLPSERAELYDALLSMLLSRRDAERRGIETLLTLTDTQRIAERIAVEYLTREVDELPRGELVRRLRAFLGSFRNDQVRDLRPGIVLDYLISRTGVLREIPPRGQIDFWHKSFQEYLAAKAIVAGGDDQQLLAHRNDTVWREIIIWACSLMPEDRASRLVTGILKDTPQSRDGSEYLWSLALSCAHYAIQLSHRAQQAVGRCASRLIPPRNPTGLDVIVSLGQAAVPFLRRILDNPMTESHHELVISALARIGGEAANTVLSLVAPDVKLKWAEQLGHGWQQTGSEDYARRVLGNVPANAGRYFLLEADGVRQLRSVSYISEAYRLAVYLTGDDLDEDAIGNGSDRLIWKASLSSCSWSQVLLFLRHYQSVRELVVSQLDDDAAVDRDGDIGAELWPDVKRVTIVGAGVVDLGGLRIFPNLEILTISESEDVVASAGFSHLPLLREVSIDLPYLDSMFNMEWAGNIERLYCSPWPYSTLEHLRDLSRLRELSVPFAPSLESLAGVEDLPAIVTVDVSFCERLSDIRDALRAPSLGSLNVTGCDELEPIDSFGDYSLEIEVGEEDLGWIGPESPTPPLLPERWRFLQLSHLSDAELGVRGWDDWSFWEQIRGDADEWEANEPVEIDEIELKEGSLTVYSSFEAWSEDRTVLDEAPADLAEEEQS
jgi:NACHT domain